MKRQTEKLFGTNSILLVSCLVFVLFVVVVLSEFQEPGGMNWVLGVDLLLTGMMGYLILLQFMASGKFQKARSTPEAQTAPGTNIERESDQSAAAAVLDREFPLLQMLDTLPQSIYWKDAGGRYLGCNRAYLRRLGLRLPIEIVGKTDDDIAGASARTYASTELDERVLKGLQPPMHIIKRRPLADGREIWLDVSKLPLVDDGEQIVGVISILEDVTARKQADEALRQSDGRYQLLFNESRDGLLLLYGDCIVDANETFARWFGCDRSSLTGISPARSWGSRDPEAEAPWLEPLAHANNPTTTTPVTFAWSHTSGEREYTFEVVLSGVELSGKRFVLATVRDQSEKQQASAERQQMLEKLERAKRMESLSLLAGGVAHDLNNMLGPLVAYPDMILEQLPTYCSVKEDILSIRRAAEDAAAVIGDLLTLARRGRYDMAPLFIDRSLRAFRDSISVRDLARRRPDIQFLWDIPRSDLPIVGSEPHLFKVLLNLLVNGSDAMPTGGTCTIQAAVEQLSALPSGFADFPHGRYVRVTVRDTGVGISPGDLRKIFEPYYSSKKMGNSSGSGLGLAIVYGVVKDHGGYYDIETAVGAGTAFHLYFPLSQVPPMVDRIELKPAGGTESILLVDDVQEQREIALRILKGLGYQVRVCDSFESGAQALRTHPADLAVIDMLLGDDQDGLDLIKLAREIRPDQRILVVTGFASGERLARALAIGDAICLHKPFTRDQLAIAVRSSLDGTASQMSESWQAATRSAVPPDGAGEPAVCGQAQVRLERYTRRTVV